MPISPGLRFVVLKALLRAREHVVHGYPTLRAAFHYQRLPEMAWVEVDRAIDSVRFDEGAGIPSEAPPREHREPVVVRELREAAAAAKANAHLPWEDEIQGLSRAQCVVLLTRAYVRASELPVHSPGPLFPHLPITDNRSRE